MDSSYMLYRAAPEPSHSSGHSVGCWTNWKWKMSLGTLLRRLTLALEWFMARRGDYPGEMIRSVYRGNWSAVMTEMIQENSIFGPRNPFIFGPRLGSHSFSLVHRYRRWMIFIRCMQLVGVGQWSPHTWTRWSHITFYYPLNEGKWWKMATHLSHEFVVFSCGGHHGQTQAQATIHLWWYVFLCIRRHCVKLSPPSFVLHVNRLHFILLSHCNKSKRLWPAASVVDVVHRPDQPSFTQ